MIQTPQSIAGRNRDYSWNKFDPETYFKVNYLELRDDDRQILEIVRDFFSDTLAAEPLPAGARGVDVGTGANIYPALTMLPFCEEITLYELSTANIEWLRHQKKMEWPSWEEAWSAFWAQLSKKTPYHNLVDPKAKLTKRVDIQRGNIFDLPFGSIDRWDVGTMFFVAESITRQTHEFTTAVDDFFAVLKPDAPFAMAFMEHSMGYHVGDQHYPATYIDEGDVWKCLINRARDVEVRHVDAGGNPLRDGYTGMIVAHGRVEHSYAEETT